MMVLQLEHSTANLQVVGSNLTCTCICGICFPRLQGAPQSYVLVMISPKANQLKSTQIYVFTNVQKNTMEIQSGTTAVAIYFLKVLKI